MVFMLRKAVLPPNGSAGWRSPGIGGRLPAGYPRRLCNDYRQADHTHKNTGCQRACTL